MKFFRYALFSLSVLSVGFVQAETEKSADTPTETAKTETAKTAVDPKFYTTVSGKRVSNDKKIEVVELFWYTCPHCDGFDPYIKKWKKTIADDVAFYPMPAVFPNDRRLPLAKAFFVAQELNILDKVHEPLFNAIHREHRNLSSALAIAEIFEKEAGINEDDFMKRYNSFSVDSAVRKAAALTKSYGVNSVPSLVVNAKYRMNGSQINGHKKMLALVNDLIEQERQANK